MLFKRHWRMIRENRIATVTCYLIVFPVVVYLFCRHSIPVALLCASVIPLSLLGTFLLAKTYDGFFEDQIAIDETGVTWITKNRGSKQFRWEEIRAIQNAECNRFAAMVITNEHNDQIWFYSSDEIKAYMETIYQGFSSVYDPAHPFKPGEGQLR